jgi:peptidoglycan/LPS O-acetylase OafA/YrhL
LRNKFKNILRIEIDAKRIFGLDILRACAILFVMMEHSCYLMPLNLKWVTNLFVFDGVTVFFVLSGFLIAGILIKILNKQEPNKKVLFNFWVRRWFRTLPNYFLILLILITLAVLYNKDFSVWNIERFFIFSQNLFNPHPSWFPEAWSLSVEEWFYLLIPTIIILLIKRFKFNIRKSILITACVIIIIVTTYRFIRFATIPKTDYIEWDLIFRKQVFTRLDSLMYGVLGAYIQFYLPVFWSKYKNILFTVGITLFLLSKVMVPKILIVGGLYHCVFSFSEISIATLFMLPLLSALKNGKGYLFRMITYISLISYSMYLVNYSLIQVFLLDKITISTNIYTAPFLKLFLYWFFTILLSILIYKFFEVPTTALRDFYKVKRTKLIANRN